MAVEQVDLPVFNRVLWEFELESFVNVSSYLANGLKLEFLSYFQ